MQDSGLKKKDTKEIIPQRQSLYTRGGEPKVMKKVVNSVLASALALSVAPMAVGAAEDEQQQVDSQLQRAINRLQALELVVGDDKGQLNLDKPITRAEFATLVVRARGLASGVPLAQYQAKYKDIQVSDWYSGWINVASGENLVKGYPDNTFGPNNNVTYAEAATMLVRALGYEPAVSQAAWPNNFIAKAAELGISDGVQINPNQPAIRADVFKMLDNALNIDLMKPVTYGTQLEYKQIPGTSLVQDYLNVTVYDVDWYTKDDVNNQYEADDLPFVSGVPAIELGKLRDDEVTFTSTKSLKGTYKVANGINPNEFAGQHVQVWVKESAGLVIWMEESVDEEVLRTEFDALYYDGEELDEDNYDDPKFDLDDEDEIRIELGGRKYEFDKNAVFTYNYQRIKDLEDFVETVIEDSNAGGMQTKAVLNGQGKISYIHIVDDVQGDRDSKYKFGSEVIKEIDTDDMRLEFFEGDDVDFEDLEEGVDFIVLRNGERATFADLQPLDVVNIYYANGDKDKRIVVATSSTVSGTVDKVTIKSDNDNRLVIDGKTYRMRGKVTISDDNNKSADVADNDDIRDLLDDEVTLYLDSSGRVRHILINEGNDSRVKAVVIKDGYYNESDDELTFEVVTEKGVEKKVKITDADDITFENDDDEIDSDNLADYVKFFDVSRLSKNNPPIFVELELDKEGDVESVEILDVRELVYMDEDKFQDKSDDDTLDGYDITDSTVVFDLTGELKKTGNRDYIDDADTVKWSSIEGEKHEVFYLEDDGDIEYVFVISGDLSGDGMIGFVTEFGKASDDTVTIINEKGEVVEYKLDGSYKEARKKFGDSDLIYFTLNGDDEVVINKVEVLASPSDEYFDGSYEINPKYTKVDDIVVGRVLDFDKKEVELEVYANGKLQEKTFQLSNAVIVYDDEIKKTASKNDLVILIDTDDSSSKYDFMLILDVDYKKLDREEVEAFLKQTPKNDDDNGGDDEQDLIDKDQVEALATEIAGIYLYTVSAPAGTVDPNATVTVTVGDETKKAEVNSDGSFNPVEFAGEEEVTQATINVTLGDKTAEVKVKIQFN